VAAGSLVQIQPSKRQFVRGALCRFELTMDHGANWISSLGWHRSEVVELVNVSMSRSLKLENFGGEIEP
jgi:hypothetical protein